MRRRGTGSDLQLELRMIVVLILLTATAAGVAYGMALLYLLWSHLWPVWTVIIVGLIIGLGRQYGAGLRILLDTADARLLPKHDNAYAAQVVDRLAAHANLAPPRVAISALPVPNAFVLGTSSRNSIVVLTALVLDTLTPAELEAVIGHEISHIANGDGQLMTVATLPKAIGGELVDTESVGMYVWFFLWPFGALLWCWSTLLTLALSRYREFAADRGAALITGAPEQVMSALQKLADEMSKIPRRDMRLAPGLEPLLIMPTRPRLALLADHPPLDERLRALSRIAREMGRPLR